MSKAADKGCVSCHFAEWQRTPTGRIKQRTSGKCAFPLPDLSKIIPSSARVANLYKAVIWPDYGTDCPTYERAAQ